MPARAFLIDGHAFCYRAFYAIRQLSTKAGRPTNAVYGFAVMLNRLLKEERPDYLAVAFDMAGPTFRHERFADYKRHRPPMPETLVEQIPMVHRLVEAHRIPIFELAGYEADDVLATLATRLAGPSTEVLLVTGDKDALQLIGPHVKVYNPQHDNAVLDERHVQERFGVEPRRIIEIMALMGDATDNIPGVPGIGEKTAVELIGRFGTVEGLLEHLDDVPSAAQRQRLAGHAAQARLSRELAKVDTAVPLEASLGALRRVEPDWAALRTLYRELEFRVLLKELPAPEASAAAAVPVRVAASSGDVAQMAAAARQAGGCAVVPAGARALAVCVQPETHWITASADAGWHGVRALLEDAAIAKTTHDLKALWRWCLDRRITLRGASHDTMIAAYLLNPATGAYPLGELVEEYLGRTITVPVDAAGGEDAPLAAPPSPAPWCAAADAIRALAEHLELLLAARAVDRLFREVELPLCEVLARMESCGIALDRQALEEMSRAMERRLAELTRQIYAEAGETFNIQSPRQLAVILFEKLQLPVVKRTKTGPSTDFDVLTKLADKHPLPKLLVEFRELSKLRSTYVDALPALMDAATNRLHSTFNQTVTATGRLSSSNPNLQNIPVKTDLGRQIRRAFVPGEPGWQLLSADYSQIELRVLAHLSEDPALVEAFQQGRDIHTFTASLIYGVDERDVTPAMRGTAKTTNFGLLYGMGAVGLSRDLAIPLAKAQAFIEAYFQRYPRVRAYLDGQIALAKEQGFVTTLLGRRRSLPELASPDGGMRAFGERAAINTPVQGSAADIIKMAMLRVAEALGREGLRARLLLQVHDELVFEAPEAEVGALQSLVRRQMEGALALRVPLVVTLKTGPNWLEMTGIT